MLAKFISKDEIEEFKGIYACDEEITLENGEKETVRIVFTNSEAENKARESGEWFDVVEQAQNDEGFKKEYLFKEKDKKIYEIWTKE